MKDYYSQKLSADRLRRVYEIAPPRVRRYLESEIAFVLQKIAPSERVLELGCGYGRVLKRLLIRTPKVTGIDTSHVSLILAREKLGAASPCCLCAMNAEDLGFPDDRFDVVVCIQNGISAFKVDQRQLIRESIRVTRAGGRVLFSSYSERFWDDRLEWFQRQADHGLIGEIDHGATGNGVIVCKDGFRATTIGPEAFRSLTVGINAAPEITEVDGASIFCVIRVPKESVRGQRDRLGG